MRTFQWEDIKECEHVGAGCRGDVYKIDEFRVIKVFYASFNDDNYVLRQVIREIEGAKTMIHACPILEEVVVENFRNEGITTIGVIKPYIPGSRPSQEKVRAMLKELQDKNLLSAAELCDSGDYNYREDLTGHLWRVDTDTLGLDTTPGSWKLLGW